MNTKVWTTSGPVVDAREHPAAAMTTQPHMTEWALAAILLLLFLALAFWSNQDLSSGRYMLFMDELITHDDVMRILLSGSLSDLIWNIVAFDQRYGRSMFLLTSLIALPPWLLGGEQAFIIATRMAQALFLGAAYLVLSFLLIRSNILRVIAMLTLIALPSTAYYATMPKPEPLQLLWLSVFLWLFVGKQRVTGWSWLFLGLAFGAKISVIVLIPMFATLAWLAAEGDLLAKTRALIVASFPWFLLGWLVSVPIILTGPSGIESYLNWTFHNTGHGADSAAVTIASWIEHLIHGWISFSPPATALFFASLLALTLTAAVPLTGPALCALTDRRSCLSSLRRVVLDERAAGLIVFTCGLLWALTIMIGVKRVWDFYLHIPLALMIIGGLMSAERLLGGNALARSLALVLSGIVALNLLKTMPAALAHHQALASRSTQEGHLRKEREYEVMVDMLESDAARLDERLRVLADPQLYMPASDDRIYVNKFYGPFKGWDQRYDIIVAYCFRFAASESKAEAPCPLDGEARSRIADKGADCGDDACYRRREGSPDGILYLARDGLGED